MNKFKQIKACYKHHLIKGKLMYEFWTYLGQIIRIVGMKSCRIAYNDSI